MDIVDEANDLAMERQQKALEAVRCRPPEAPELGFCLSCQEPLKGRRWCDSDCRDEWEHRVTTRRKHPRLFHAD